MANLRLSLRIAGRYLRGKRSANAVPVLSRISMTAIAVGCGALLVLFSVFNGFNAVIDKFYTAFYSDLRIRPAQGKTFIPTEAQLRQLSRVPGVQLVAPILEDQVLASGDGTGTVVMLRGVDGRYFSVASLKQYIRYGSDSVSTEGFRPTALLGLGVAARLGISVENAFSRLHLHYPDASASPGNLDPGSAFRSLDLKPDGIFAVESEFDEHYILAPLPMVQDLLGAGGAISSFELKLDPRRASAAAKSIQSLFGSGFRVENRYAQNKTFYSVMAAEKWAVYLILLLVLLIASFNLVGALSMLVLEKRKDIAILQAMGADRSTVRSIFIMESMLWSLVGGAAGILFGALLCLGQQHFGWVRLEGSFLIEAYPVKLQPADVLVVLATALGLGALAGWLPSWRAARMEPGVLR
jgi:lipoprotein-releasing system permease protein